MCSSTNIIRAIKSWQMRHLGHVPHIRYPGRIKPTARHKWEDNIKIILKVTVLNVWTEFIWLRIRTNGRPWQTQ
jgi:hypothetical protein